MKLKALIRRTLAVVLTAALLAGAIPAAALAADENGYSFPLTGTLSEVLPNLTSVAYHGEAKDSYVYSNDWFVYGKGTVASGELGLMSLQLAMSNGEDNCARELLGKLNFKDIHFATEYGNTVTDEKKLANKQEAVFAHKTLSDGSELFVIVPRGINYTTGWKSNLTLGESGPFEGFFYAMQYVYDCFGAYAGSLGKSPAKAKYWVAGHSRGAAIANLLGKRFADDMSSKGNYTADDLFFYTYGCPNVDEPPEKTRASGDYSFIHNYNSSADSFSKLYVPDLTYRYGETRTLQELYGDESDQDILSYLEKLDGSLHKAYLQTGMAKDFKEVNVKINISEDVWKILDSIKADGLTASGKGSEYVDKLVADHGETVVDVAKIIAGIGQSSPAEDTSQNIDALFENVFSILLPLLKLNSSSDTNSVDVNELANKIQAFIMNETGHDNPDENFTLGGFLTMADESRSQSDFMDYQIGAGVKTLDAFWDYQIENSVDGKTPLGLNATGTDLRSAYAELLQKPINDLLDFLFKWMSKLELDQDTIKELAEQFTPVIDNNNQLNENVATAVKALAATLLYSVMEPVKARTPESVISSLANYYAAWDKAADPDGTKTRAGLVYRVMESYVNYCYGLNINYTEKGDAAAYQTFLNGYLVTETTEKAAQHYTALRSALQSYANKQIAASLKTVLTVLMPDEIENLKETLDKTDFVGKINDFLSTLIRSLSSADMIQSGNVSALLASLLGKSSVGDVVRRFLYALNDAGSFYHNMTRILYAHYPEVYLSWMKAISQKTGIQASLPAGRYTGSRTVTLSPTGGEAAIEYSLDGGNKWTEGNSVSLSYGTTTILSRLKGAALTWSFTYVIASSGGGGGGSSSTNPGNNQTTNNAGGSTTKTTANADGSFTTVTTAADGSTGTTQTDAQGNVTSITAEISEKAVETAKQNRAPIPVPVDEVDPAVPVPVHIAIPASAGSTRVSEMPRVEIPLKRTGPGIVARINGAIVRECYEGSLIVPVSGPCDIEIIENAKSFDDVASSAWYAGSVSFVTAREIFNGTGSGFEPDGGMTRAMAAQVLYNYDRGSVPGGTSAFADVNDGDWFAGAVGWASDSAIVSGYGDSFGPGDSITRQDLVIILYRYAKGAGYDVDGAGSGTEALQYSDASDMADYASAAMRWAVSAGIIGGYEDGTLRPTATATRAEVAKIFASFVRSAK